MNASTTLSTLRELSAHDGRQRIEFVLRCGGVSSKAFDADEQSKGLLPTHRDAAALSTAGGPA